MGKAVGKWFCGAAGAGLVGDIAVRFCVWAYKGISTTAGGSPVPSLTWNVWLGLVLLAVFLVMHASSIIQRWRNRITNDHLIGQLKIDLDKLRAEMLRRDGITNAYLATHAGEIQGLKDGKADKR
jgi:hypothetical protein